MLVIGDGSFLYNPIIQALGYDLIEWTFDPLQAMNAHFNFAKLGGVVEEYAPNFYGESTSTLHRGTPTDRVVLLCHFVI